jgi:uncharacterized protein
MRILIEITHPAHVHFFRNPIRHLSSEGHEIRITSRDKDCTLDLLDRHGIEHRCLSRQKSGAGMLKELIARNRALIKEARAFRPDVIAGLGGICAAQVGRLLRIPSVVFYDTETAHLQNALTYPFASRVVVPECYRAWTPARKTVRYRGYHELSYLHPNYFQPDSEIAVRSGLDPERDNFLIRLVSWKANHDVGRKGWPPELLDSVANTLQGRGKVIISSEGELPDHLNELRYQGDPAEIHHLLAYCRACIGESPTMASEAAILGVPFIYANMQHVGYVIEQAEQYKMGIIPKHHDIKTMAYAIVSLLSNTREDYQDRYRKMLSDIVDVCQFASNQMIEAAESKKTFC